MKELFKKILLKLLEKIKQWLSGGEKPVENVIKEKPVSKPVKEVASHSVEEEDVGDFGDPEDPKTNFKKAEVFAMLWKPESDTSHDSVVVAWSDNISYKDIKCLITNEEGKVLFDGGVYSHYVRGLNKHGKYGGINFKVGPNSKYRKQKPIIKFYLERKGVRKFIPIDGKPEIQVLKIKERLEVNYKSNLNYKK